MRYLAVKNFGEFQHYKQRTPPWIKLYNRLLDDYAFLSLSDTTRSHLMLIWLVASRHENRIPYDAAYIGRAIHTRGKVDLASLIAAGFLYVVESDASNDVAECARDASMPLAGRKRRAMTEGEREGEGEKEADKTSPARAVARRGGGASDRPAKRAAAPAHYPHYPKAACDALYELWTQRRGPIRYSRFRAETGLLFDTPTPRYAVDELAGALKLCLAVVKHQAKTARGRDAEWAMLTPERWVGRVVEWVESYRRTQADPTYLDTLLATPASKVSA